jgi:hypothetical protein
VKKALLIMAAALAAAFLLAPFTSLILPSRLRDHTYQQIMLHIIAVRETAAAKSPVDSAKALFFYTAHNALINPGDLKPYKAKALGFLIDGRVYCDYASEILANLCAGAGIHARYCMLKDAFGVSPHTVTEVLLGGKWRVFDPTEFCYYVAASGKLATLEELSANPDLIFRHRRMLAIQQRDPAAYEASVNNYRRMFPLPAEPQRSSSKLKRTSPFDRVGFVYFALFRGGFVRVYQDLYLWIKTMPLPAEDKIYYRARNYHLVQRSDRAISAYKELLKLYPDGKYAERSALFLSFVYAEQKQDLNSAIEALLPLAAKKESLYRKYALYYLGQYCRALGRSEEAQEYLRSSGAAESLDPALAN